MAETVQLAQNNQPVAKTNGKASQFFVSKLDLETIGVDLLESSLKYGPSYASINVLHALTKPIFEKHKGVKDESYASTIQATMDALVKIEKLSEDVMAIDSAIVRNPRLAGLLVGNPLKFTGIFTYIRAAAGDNRVFRGILYSIGENPELAYFAINSAKKFSSGVSELVGCKAGAIFNNYDFRAGMPIAWFFLHDMGSFIKVAKAASPYSLDAFDAIQWSPELARLSSTNPQKLISAFSYYPQIAKAAGNEKDDVFFAVERSPVFASLLLADPQKLIATASYYPQISKAAGAYTYAPDVFDAIDSYAPLARLLVKNPQMFVKGCAFVPRIAKAAEKGEAAALKEISKILVKNPEFSIMLMNFGVVLPAQKN